ncbi:unnamed protein product [Lepeophtheirus salmonis]|uniref:(salmon louse) hypothetical protein n=1 Tax=Lepeophtheirus salmonis TaxID=72036 RepID=A0A7R8H1R0_LEPSM|nr:unnamed protein product [Lepeophtheirus salmonis]CAF2798656.1 unnamed protein product [Lepeophtheirus salmonis]
MPSSSQYLLLSMLILIDLLHGSRSIDCYACGFDYIHPEHDVPGSYGYKIYNHSCEELQKLGSFSSRFVRSCPIGVQNCFGSIGALKQGGSIYEKKIVLGCAESPYLHPYGCDTEEVFVQAKDRHNYTTQKVNVEIKNLQFDSKEMVRPAPFVHRRFDSLNRPHVRTCSKLCNHPMNRELKKENDEFFKNTKISWGISDGKTLLTPNEELNLKKTEIDIRHEENEESIATSSMSNSLEGEDDEDIIPEELLLKYTKLDSPTHSGSGNFPSLEATRATPTTPTTRSQSASSTRRCKTPEKDGLTEEKKVIVLDLRRTKSTDAFSGITDISKPETKSSGNQNSSNGSPPKVINDDSTKTRSKASAKTKNKQNSTESMIKGSSTTGHRQPEVSSAKIVAGS